MSRSRVRVLLVALAALLALSFAYVPRGQVAVRESYGGGAAALGPGLHLRLPLYQRLYRYDTRPLALDEGIEIVTKDTASFRLPVSVAAWASPGDLLTFHRGRAGREPVTFIKDQVRDAVQAAAKGLNADEILMSDTTRRLGPSISADLLARGIAEDGLRIGRPSAQVVFNAVVDYLHRRFPASARRLAEQSLAADPRESLFHAAMGWVLEGEGRKADAEKEYLNALYLDPASPEPMSRLYVMYQSSNDSATIARLERLLAASVEKSPESPIHHDWLGQVYLRTHQYDKAEMSFKTAVGQAPGDPQFRISLGSLLVQEGKIDEGRAAYEEALKLRPDHPLALFNVGATYAMQGQIDKAIDYFRRSERAGPPTHALYNSLAQAYEETGKLDLAAEYLRRSLHIRPNQPDRKAELKSIEARLKKKG